MESVAASAGIPKTTLYKRYADKRELLNAVLVDRVSSWSKVSSRTDRNISDDLSARLKSRTATMLVRSEEHTSELQSLMRISYAVFCLKKKKNNKPEKKNIQNNHIIH